MTDIDYDRTKMRSDKPTSATNRQPQHDEGMQSPAIRREHIDERMRELRRIQERVRESKRAGQRAATQRRIREQKQTIERLRAGVLRRREHSEESRRRTQAHERTHAPNAGREGPEVRTLEQERRERQPRELTAHTFRQDVRQHSSSSEPSESSTSPGSACGRCPIHLLARGGQRHAHGSGIRRLTGGEGHA